MNDGGFGELEEGVEGLIHISEMSWVRHIKHPSDIFQSGEMVDAKILNIDINEKKISMGIKQLHDNPWDGIESKYPIGEDHNGIVRNLTQFGAFVELEEGIDGLVHISDMSWTKLVRHPKEIVEIGDKVKIRILEVSTDERRLSLGMKQTEENPWEKIREEFPAGKIVNGDVIKILDKGIIFNLKGGIEGIFPIKRINNDKKQEILKIFEEGKSHEVIVQEVDEESKKIILMIDSENESNENEDSLDSSNVISGEPESEKNEKQQETNDELSDDDKAV